MSFWAQKNSGNFLLGYETVGFSKKTELNGLSYTVRITEIIVDLLIK
jgi:hypothetical protein